MKNTLPDNLSDCFSAGRPLLLRWFSRNARVLPWRPKNPADRRDPYRVWISEVMLQQTQVATVLPYFERWMALFPDAAALAAAPEQEVLQAWAGLGYYARARNLQKAARLMVGLGGHPDTLEAWKALPGVGAYTAGAVTSLALGVRAPILDGNVVRVFSRLFTLPFLPGDSAEARRAYWEIAGHWSNHPKPGAINEALMELGALVCTPTSPKCDRCPLQSVCAAAKYEVQDKFPPLKKRVKAEVVSGVAVRVCHKGKVLTERRGPGAFLAGHDLFPLFLGAEAETWRAAFARRFPGLGSGRLSNVRAAGGIRHAIMTKRYAIEVWDCEIPNLPKPPAGNWIPVEEVAARLTNSLAKKIWEKGREMMNDE